MIDEGNAYTSTEGYEIKILKAGENYRGKIFLGENGVLYDNTGYAHNPHNLYLIEDSKLIPSSAKPYK